MAVRLCKRPLASAAGQRIFRAAPDQRSRAVRGERHRQTDAVVRTLPRNADLTAHRPDRALRRRIRWAARQAAQPESDTGNDLDVFMMRSLPMNYKFSQIAIASCNNFQNSNNYGESQRRAAALKAHRSDQAADQRVFFSARLSATESVTVAPDPMDAV